MELEDVKVTDPPGQNEVGPLTEIVGVGGAGAIITPTTEDVEVQFPLETVT